MERNQHPELLKYIVHNVHLSTNSSLLTINYETCRETGKCNLTQESSRNSAYERAPLLNLTGKDFRAIITLPEEVTETILK